uniref:Uncharacterized protein n=1 Tax=Fagus sylvatica TaxID=28930 RepID=A0A2N9EGL8_FAGSY
MKDCKLKLDEHSGAIRAIVYKVKLIGLEAKLDNGFDNLQAMMRELLQRQQGVEQPAVQPVVEQPRQETLGLQAQIKPRVEVQMGEGMENGQNRPILGDFGDPIEERRNEGNNARFMPQFQGHFDAPYEEPWLGMRQGRQQGQQGQQAQLEPILGDFGDSIVESLCGSTAAGQQAQPQRHASQAREPRNAPWPQGDVVEPWYDHGGGKGNWGRARNYQGPQDRDPYGKNQDPLQRQQGRQAREPRAMELEFPRFKGGDPTSWMFRAIQYFEYYQVHDASKLMSRGSTRPSYEANKDNWEQHSSQQVAAQFVPKVAAQIDPKVAECDPKVAAKLFPKRLIDPKVIAQLDPKVAVQIDPKVATQLNPKVAAQMDPKVVDPKPTSAKPTMMAMKLYLIEEVQEEEGAYVTSYEEEERVEWCEERRNTKEESINKDIQVPSRYWLIGRSPLMKKHLTKKQLEDSSSIRPQQDHNLEDKVFRWGGQC